MGVFPSLFVCVAVETARSKWGRKEKMEGGRAAVALGVGEEKEVGGWAGKGDSSGLICTDRLSSSSAKGEEWNREERGVERGERAGEESGPDWKRCKRGWGRGGSLLLAAVILAFVFSSSLSRSSFSSFLRSSSSFALRLAWSKSSNSCVTASSPRSSASCLKPSSQPATVNVRVGGSRRGSRGREEKAEE
jgi:hypothetical protein